MSFIDRLGINGQTLKYYCANVLKEVHEKIKSDWMNYYSDCKIADISISRGELYVYAMVVFERVTDDGKSD